MADEYADDDYELEIKDVKSRKDRPTGSTHMGDIDFFEETVDEIGDATWAEVCQTCCVHDAKEWGMIFIGVVMACFFLYFFLIGLELLGSGAKVMTGCAAGGLFGDDTNPVASLMIGILSTVLLQSSSTTTSIVVSLVGANTIPAQQGIYMIQGANIGTSVTNTIVAMGQMGDGDQLERAFAGATVHDMFNFLSVAILFPVEVAFNYLRHLTEAMTKNATVTDGDKWEGPIKKIVSPLGNKIIISNKDVITGVAKGESCSDFYPIVCEDYDNPTKKSCSQVGLIGCDKKSNECPAFFDSRASEGDDKLSGAVAFIIALAILISCLIGLVWILRKMLLGMSTRIIYKATNINGYLAMAVGAGITVCVQSSSITTSTLTPFVGMGALQLEQMFPLTLGANIGTTVTAIMAAMVSDKIESLQVALAHLMFNITGIVIWYPVPFMRNIPLTAARKLGRATRLWRGFPLVYIGVMFFLLPLVMLGLSSLYEQKSAAFTTLAVLLTLVVAFAILYLIYWCRCAGGMEKCQNCMVARQRRKEYEKALPDDMEYVKQRLEALAEHTGLPEEEDEDSDDDDDDDYYQEDEKDVEVGVKAYEDEQDEQEEIAA